MASASPSPGVNASMWAGGSQPPSNKTRWGGKETGSGLGIRGTNRGRGRGGRVGRGGNRTGGPGREDKDNKPSKPNGNLLQEPTQNAPPPASPSPVVPAVFNEPTVPLPPKATHTNNRVVRKVSEAKPRKLPPIKVDPPPAPSADSPVSAISATTPKSRRRRSTQIRGVSNAPAKEKKSPSEPHPSSLRPEKSPVKDLPPHLIPRPPPETPSFDIKHDIDALVERVRAVAMDRPNTPGSHIDWAGEDDDSLPDLDDWGVTSVTDKSSSSAALEQRDLISPILADALKCLPTIEFGSPLAVPVSGSPAQKGSPAMLSVIPPIAPTKFDVEEDTPRGPPSHREVKSANLARNVTEKVSPPKNELLSERSDAVARLPADSSTPSSFVEKEGQTKRSPLKKGNTSLHPSLPAKPVDAIDALKRVPRKPAPLLTPESVVESGLPKNDPSEVVHPLKVNGSVEQELPETANESSPSPEPAAQQGVASSIHAPTRSAPSHITTHASVSTPSFHPTHGRAHTMGRPSGFRRPFSPSNGSFPDAPSDDRPSRKDRINHARNHSSPPVGPGTAHSRTPSRPVITMGALSRLKRDLGAPPTPKRNAADSVTPPKEIE